MDVSMDLSTSKIAIAVIRPKTSRKYSSLRVKLSLRVLARRYNVPNPLSLERYGGFFSKCIWSRLQGQRGVSPIKYLLGLQRFFQTWKIFNTDYL